VRVWIAASISVFGSCITRLALPVLAILLLSAGPIEVAVLRALDLVAALAFGLVARPWVDRLRPRAGPGVDRGRTRRAAAGLYDEAIGVRVSCGC
ncbi:MAG TPA: hypothetical protein VFH63_06955, partial [candidate division Zixibacteria bacterium]|nr:hypothetical protein [candidate division Zixibacteria bacterium]